MGHYIEAPEDTGKAEWLVQHHDARRLDGPPEDFLALARNGLVPVAVAHNPTFEAAGIAYEPAEADHFAGPDDREIEWLTLRRATVLELVPAVADEWVMGPRCRYWNEFTERLEGPEGCDFNDKDGLTWKCKGGYDKTFALDILAKHYPWIDAEASVDLWNDTGGHCDCEILFNVEDGVAFRERAA